MNLSVLKVTIDNHGLYADHNMPCAICHVNHAVINCQTERFEPCWKCQDDGWHTEKLRGWLRKRVRA